jgi:flagellar biogenesis protein FliO
MQAVTFIFAFVAVLALIGVAAWLVRRFASNRLGTNTQRGRMPRLAVIDAAAVDGRRRLVLVRRDNIEHLLMIGGPSDIVVESNIVRATPVREQLPQRPSGIASSEPPAPRLAPLPDAGNWSEPEPVRHESFDYAEPPLPELPPRPIRQPFPDEVRRTAAPERRPPAPDPDRRAMEQERRVLDPMAGFALEPLGRPEPRAEQRPDALPPRMPRSEPMPRNETMPRSETMPRGEPMQRGEPMPRGEPMMPRAPRQADAPKPPPPPRAPERPAPLPPSADQSLAEMAQRLEAALRRPVGETAAPPPAPEPPPARPAPRNESPPIVTPVPVPPPPPAPPPNNAFDSLEDEMASLLGRSKSSSS